MPYEGVRPLRLEDMQVGMDVVVVEKPTARRPTPIVTEGKIEKIVSGPRLPMYNIMVNRKLFILQKNPAESDILAYHPRPSKELTRAMTEVSFRKNVPYNVTADIFKMVTGYSPKRAIPVQPRPPTAEELEERATQETLAAMKGGLAVKTSRRTRKQKRSRRVKRRGVRLGTRRIHRF